MLGNSFGVSDLGRLGGRFGLVGSFGEAVGGLMGSWASYDVRNRFRDGVVLRSIWQGHHEQMLTNVHNFGVTKRVK